ncbi:general amino acid permease AGP2 [Pholiota molesta]|nr:general amino acid permease AGP2 [Pholiota molesta]
MKTRWTTRASMETIPHQDSDNDNVSFRSDKKEGQPEVQIIEDLNSSSSSFDRTRRRLKSRHIQLIGVGGTIGTALFVQIGEGLTKGGPGSLFLAFTIWCSFILAVNNCLSEMVSWIPISSPFVRFADRFVDPALGFCTGINFFVFEAILIPFEIVAFNVVLHFGQTKYPLAHALNLFAVKYYGESEFWLALGKALLATGVIVFTFVTMVGGNHFTRPMVSEIGIVASKVPGAPFAEYTREGNLGRFLGFLACLIQASFTIAGPDYISMTAGEAQAPRKVMPQAFNGTFFRLAAFFILGSLCVGIVVPYNDPDLINAISNAHPGAGSSPYVIAMKHLGIPVLPHIVNAAVLTAVFSAGNSYVFCASRTLFGLALERKAPRFLTRCTSTGVPIYCVGITLGVALLAFLQVSNNSSVVLQWFINLVTASQLLNYAVISFTYIRFYRGLKAQGISRDTLPHKSFWQPFCGYYAFTGTLIMAFVGGYSVFVPGNWNVPSFIFSYAMIGILPVLFIYWKIRHRTSWQKLETMTFFEQERMIIDQYEEEINS